jgi:drug/metabolite transporter (DMT)-like permease
VVLGLCHRAGDRGPCPAAGRAVGALPDLGPACGDRGPRAGAKLAAHRAQARAVILFGLCQNAPTSGLNFIAVQWVEASLAVIIAAAMPLMVAALGWALKGERIAPLGVAGLVAGFVGVGLIMGTRLTDGADRWGSRFACWARWRLPLPP